ncbi:MAG: hypothetical protein HQL72_02205 [Magnetococcales bacterium]|nr:hypothetical protein [Magnetococcales bacterium]
MSTECNYAVFQHAPKFCPECKDPIRQGEAGALQLSDFVRIHQASPVYRHCCGFLFKLHGPTAPPIRPPQPSPKPAGQWQLQCWDGTKWFGTPFPDEESATKAFEEEKERDAVRQKRAIRLINQRGFTVKQHTGCHSGMKP